MEVLAKCSMNFINMLRTMTILILLGALLQANDTFVNLSISKSSLLVPTVVTNKYYGSSVTMANANAFELSIAAGQKLHLYRINSRFEPNIGVMAFTSYDISSTVLFFEVPFMYGFYILNERFSIGPKLKYLYFTDMTYTDNGKVRSLGGRSYGAGGVRLMYERKDFDFFVAYEYLPNATANYEDTESKSVIDFSGGYVEVGIRWKI